MVEKKEETAHSSRSAYFVIAHCAGDIMIALLFGIEHYVLKSKHRLYNIHIIYHSTSKRDSCCWRLTGAVIQNIHKLSKMSNLDVNFFQVKIKLQTSNFANVSEVDQTVGIPAYKKNIYQEGCFRGCPFLTDLRGI